MILLDANIVLELLLPGRPQKAKVIDWLADIQEKSCITMLTVHLVLHFGFKEKLTLQDIKKFLSNYPKIALLPEDYVKAMEILRDNDHEDALQLAVAERIGCTHIVSLDKKFSQNYGHRIGFINPLTQESVA